MENRTKFIIVIALGITLVLIGILFAYQQKTITNLKNEVSGIKKDTLNDQKAALSSPFSVKAVQNTITDNTRKIKGVITAKNENLLDVEAEIVDFSKLPMLKEESLLGSENSLPKIKKDYKVAVNDKTQYPSMEYENLSVGMKVSVTSDELVYKSDDLTASEIIIPVAVKAPLGDFLKAEKKINGQVKEMNNKYLIVEVHWMDYSKVTDPKNIDFAAAPTIIKEYKIFINSDTVFPNGKNDLKTGDNVTAHSDNPTFSVTEFTATKIEGPIQPQ
ncbi:MAG: hypothetical protein WC831_03515 [Parcubacteria group bacterium]|jgi:hypothetical protein